MWSEHTGISSDHINTKFSMNTSGSELKLKSLVLIFGDSNKNNNHNNMNYINLNNNPKLFLITQRIRNMRKKLKQKFSFKLQEKLYQLKQIQQTIILKQGFLRNSVSPVVYRKVIFSANLKLALGA